MDFVNDLISNLGPKVTEQVTSKFGLPQETAEKVLPSIVPTVASSLQEKLSGGDENALTGLLSSVTGGQDGGSALSNLFGSKLDSVVSSFAGQVGVDSGKAQGILGSVVPMIMSFISNKSGGSLGSVSSMIGNLGGVSSIADSVGGAAGKSGVLGKLSGMFGK